MTGQETYEGPTYGPELIVNILTRAGRSLTTREVQAETHKVNKRCLASSMVALNMMRRMGVIQGRRSEDRKGRVWWVEP